MRAAIMAEWDDLEIAHEDRDPSPIDMVRARTLCAVSDEDTEDTEDAEDAEDAEDTVRDRLALIASRAGHTRRTP